ncbi:hypothetical protein CDEST_13335 [Colletotrichum destructivum]|uniref:Uncharacterized protein n=1 Tax=Colletotrichum destructivum TaxID=34406 RepID=A0AAX4IYS7_9PEZI|nr:hypothetical protein CDEST_13335 [Colletotrichum destructivum]
MPGHYNKRGGGRNFVSTTLLQVSLVMHANDVMYQRPPKPTVEERVEQKRKDFQKAQAELLQAEELHWARAHSLELLTAMPDGLDKEAFKRMLRAFQTFPKDKPELVAAEGPTVTDETPAAATTDNIE